MLLLADATPARAQLVLSEAMADPSVLADDQGEFLELANAGGGALRAETVLLVVDGDTLTVAGIDLAAGECILLCRDSAALSRAGAPCRRTLEGLSLPNTRSIAVTVGRAGSSLAFDLPPAKAGVSWENTMEEGAGYLRFARSAQAFLGADSATPGFRNSRSRRQAARDLGIAGAVLRKTGGRTELEARVENRGVEPAGAWLTVRADRDWDGKAETPVDSLTVPAGGGTLRLDLDPDAQGVLELALEGDGNPADNAYRVIRSDDPSLEISEACPAPEEGPEWAELRNATGEGGGFARTLHLPEVEFRGRALGEGAGKLAPGEYLLLTEDADALRGRLGSLKVRILEAPGWRAMRNTGDTLRLALRGHPLDSLVYGAKEASVSGCLERPASRAGGGPGSVAGSMGPTPGYPAPRGIERYSLKLSARILDPGGSLSMEAEAPPGGRYSIKAFDLEGNCVRMIGSGGAGSRVHAWSGEGPGGAPLPSGPYIIGFCLPGETARRQVVVLAGPR